MWILNRICVRFLKVRHLTDFCKETMPIYLIDLLLSSWHDLSMYVLFIRLPIYICLFCLQILLFHAYRNGDSSTHLYYLSWLYFLSGPSMLCSSMSKDSTSSLFENWEGHKNKRVYSIRKCETSKRPVERIFLSFLRIIDFFLSKSMSIHYDGTLLH